MAKHIASCMIYSHVATPRSLEQVSCGLRQTAERDCTETVLVLAQLGMRRQMPRTATTRVTWSGRALLPRMKQALQAARQLQKALQQPAQSAWPLHSQQAAQQHVHSRHVLSSLQAVAHWRQEAMLRLLRRAAKHPSGGSNNRLGWTRS